MTGNGDPFGDLREWSSVLDRLREAETSGRLDEVQAGLIRLIRYRQNWQIREQALISARRVMRPMPDLLGALAAVVKDEGTYADARILAARALGELVPRSEPAMGPEGLDAGRIPELLEQQLSVPEAPVVHLAIREALAKIRRPHPAVVTGVAGGETARKPTGMCIGVPREIMLAEHRVAATPETVAELRRTGFDVLVERGAGAGIYASDEEYRAAGASIAADAVELYGSSDLVLKVKQPMQNRELGRHEADMLLPGSVLIAFLHPATPSNHEMVRRLQERRVTAFTLDSIPRTLSHAQVMDALTSMSTVTGYRAVLLAATSFPRFVPVIGTAVGATRPAKFLILGAGVVGLQAIATAKRLGGAITVVDIRPEAREQATSLGAKVAGFEVPAGLAVGEGGYSRALPEEWLALERAALEPLVKEADIVIASALVPGERAPVLITGSMVSQMKPGSVIVDVSIDQGGNCEMTHAGEITTAMDVVVCGLQNIPGGMPVDSTWLFAKNVLHVVGHLFPHGPGAPVLADEIAQSMLVTHAGEIVHAGALKAMHELEDTALVGA